MHSFEILNKGWLVTHSDENKLKINLNNVTRIQTWINEWNEPISDREAHSYNISFELNGNPILEKEPFLSNNKFEQSFWGFENVFVFSYLNEESWNEAIKKIDDYLNS